MEKKDITLPYLKSPNSSSTPSSSLYFIRYRNNIMTRIMVEPIYRNSSNNSKNKRLIEYKFSSLTPIKRPGKKKINGDFTFKDKELQQKYDNLMKALKVY